MFYLHTHNETMFHIGCFLNFWRFRRSTGFFNFIADFCTFSVRSLDGSFSADFFSLIFGHVSKLCFLPWGCSNSILLLNNHSWYMLIRYPKTWKESELGSFPGRFPGWFDVILYDKWNRFLFSILFTFVKEIFFSYVWFLMARHSRLEEWWNLGFLFYDILCNKEQRNYKNVSPESWVTRQQVVSACRFRIKIEPVVFLNDGDTLRSASMCHKNKSMGNSVRIELNI